MKIKILKELKIYQQFFLQIAPAAAIAVLTGIAGIGITISIGYLIWLLIASVWKYYLLIIGYLIPLVCLVGAIDYPHLLVPSLQRRIPKLILKTLCIGLIIAETIIFWHIAKVIILIVVTIDIIIMAIGLIVERKYDL